MDQIAQVTARQIRRIGVPLGAMQLVDEARSRELRRPLKALRSIPGGSCANTMRGLGWLITALDLEQAVPLFVGAVGEDAEGRAYAAALKRDGVAAALQCRAGATGTSTVLVAPGGERTMFTCLGVSPQIKRAQVPLPALATARALYATGYLCDTGGSWDTLCWAAAEALRHEVPVVFDLADAYLVKRHHDILLAWVPGTVTVLIGNRDELRMFTGCRDDQTALAAAAALAPIVVMKVGAGGALVWSHGRAEAVPVEPTRPLDTTGAGDAFAAGFLLRWITGSDPGSAVNLGNRLAAGIVAVEGCDYARLSVAGVT